MPSSTRAFVMRDFGTSWPTAVDERKLGRRGVVRLLAGCYGAVLGAGLVGGFVLIAAWAPALAPADPNAIGAASFRGPNSSARLGTDNLGRDVLSRLLFGARTSLFVGFAAALVSTGLGVMVGGLAGYYGGRLDDALMRVTEFFQVTPRLVLGIVIVAVFGSTLWNVIAVIAGLSWPTTARLVRGQCLSLRAREFVQAAQALGASDLRVLVYTLLPSALNVVVVEASFQAANAILLEAGLSFLGLGDTSVVSWGLMLQQAQPFLRSAWWLATFPGAAIVVVVLGLNLFGDGLNDALNPQRSTASARVLY
jgi:peptide/nickel transport system permease protein